MCTTPNPRLGVLVVDHAPDRRATWVSAVARAAGFTPRAADSQDEALRTIRETNIDVLVVDMFLSEETTAKQNPDDAEGLALIKECRERHPNSKIIAITRFEGAATEIGALALNAGADDIIADWRHVRADALLEQKVRIFLAILERKATVIQ